MQPPLGHADDAASASAAARRGAPEQRHVVLVGLPAVGKSTIGRRLAKHLGRPFHDTDAVVEQLAGCTIASIFEHDGEPGFRDLEAQALAEIALRPAASVIATGGGIVTDARCRAVLLEHTFTVYLRSPPLDLLERLRRNNRRPLFRTGDLETRICELHRQRDPLYGAVASFSVDVSGRPTASVVEAIAARVLELEHSFLQEQDTRR